MKTFLGIFVILCIVIVTYSQGVTREEAQEAFKGLAANCVEKTGATKADLEAMINHEALKTRESKCLAECIMKQFETLSPDGKLSKEKFMAVSALILKNDEEKMKIAEDIVNGCLHITNDDHCELAYEFGNCLHQGIAKYKDLNLDW